MTIADTDVLIDYLAGKGEADAVTQLLSRGACHRSNWTIQPPINQFRRKTRFRRARPLPDGCGSDPKS